MIVYRIAGRKHANDLKGTGAAIHGGRWNKKGSPVLYTGESKEIALLEIIVHAPPMFLPDLDLLTLEIPDDSIEETKLSQLPSNWADYPSPTILSEIGETWIVSERKIALKVPSSVIHSASIYILNCRHPEFDKVKLLEQEDFHFDSRLRK
jgi:RES domain-containing protein